MEGESGKLKELLDSSRKILVTSHISPDPDAVCSTLLLGRTLRANYPSKQINMVLEEKPARNLDFLEGYNDIEFRDVLGAINELKPDLFILLDAPNFERCSRNNGAELRKILADKDTKVTIIDHHEEHGKDTSDVYINNHRPATAQEVYELLFDRLGLKKPQGYAQTALLGIISDTDRHRFDNPVHRQTYKIVSDLLDAGASIEKLETKLERYDKDQLDVFTNLLSHISDSGRGYTYSYIDDEFTNRWLRKKRPISSFKMGCDIFTAQFLKAFEDNLWGFIIHPELQEWPGTYGVSLRSASGSQDVSLLAHSLGGGGHKPAAGARFKADNAQEAIEKVRQAISGADDED